MYIIESSLCPDIKYVH